MSNRERAAIWLGVAIAVLSAIMSALGLIAGSQSNFPLFAAVLSGPFAACYTLTLSLLSQDRLRALPATVLFVLGMTHLFWVVAICDRFTDQFWGPILVTGSVFAVAVWATTRRLFAFLCICGGTAYALLWSSTGSESTQVLSIAGVHFGIVSGMLLYVRQSHRNYERLQSHVNRCVHCGYDLTGLPASVCPECGKP